MLDQTIHAHIEQALEKSPIIPIIRADNSVAALKTTEALLRGGLSVMEIVLRTESALDGLEAIVREFPSLHFGAGTVLNAGQCEAVIARGAKFIVAPGLDEGSITAARGAGTPIIPGIATATELQRAHNLGLRTVKFFPANLSAIKTLSSVFGDVNFIPMGGVNPDNLKSYLDVPAVLACGGSWLTPKQMIADGDFAGITRLAKDAATIANPQ